MGVTTSRDFVDAVRGAGDITRLVSDYVPLKPAGTRLKGLCPFHQEKTPSFSVDPSRQLFYCFGCNTGGDIFKFVMLYEKLDFPQAVEFLAKRWGVPIPARQRRGDDRRDRLLELNRAAEAFFRSNLSHAERGRPARDYLARRGIGAATSERLGLGYAPNAWEALRTHLLATRFKPEDLVAGGLAAPRKDGGQYDRFRHRLMFPIRDAGGRTVAFGGRALGDDEPKYVNSPETPAYVKGEHLYGLDLAREEIRRAGQAVVVEGYLDLAALLQAGVGNAVASLGTAFTPAQARLLSRYTGRVVISYDGDSAGATATVRSIDLLLENGFQVRAVEVPEGMDPDDFIRKEGAEAYGRLVAAAPSYLEYLVRRETVSRDLGRVEEKVAALNAVLPRLTKMQSQVERASWAAILADAFRIDDELVLQELRTALRAARPAVRQKVAPKAVPREVETRLVSILLGSREGRDRAHEHLEPADLEGTRVAGIVDMILRLSREGREVDYGSVFTLLDAEEDRELLTRIAFQEGPEIRDDDLDGCVRTLRRERLQRERRELQREIERAADTAMLDSLLLRKQRLGRQIDALS